MLKVAMPALGLALLVGAYPATVHAATGSDFTAPASVLAFDQKPKGNSIVVDYAQMPAPGYVAVYRTDASGKPTGEPIGYTRVERGDHRQLQVELKSAPQRGEQLAVTLYKDTDNTPDFAPGAGDKPVWTKDALPPQGRIVIQ